MNLSDDDDDAAAVVVNNNNNGSCTSRKDSCDDDEDADDDHDDDEMTKKLPAIIASNNNNNSSNRSSNSRNQQSQNHFPMISNYNPTITEDDGNNNMNNDAYNNTKNNTTTTTTTPEQSILASLDAYVLEQTTYETDVLRTASYQLVQPQLYQYLVSLQEEEQPQIEEQEMKCGFPSSMTEELLQPFRQIHQQHQQQILRNEQTKNKKKKYKNKNNCYDVSMATRVLEHMIEHSSTTPIAVQAHQQQQLPYNNNKNKDALVSQIKKQMLLHLLSQVTGETILPLSLSSASSSSSTTTTTIPNNTTTARVARSVTFQLPEKRNNNNNYNKYDETNYYIDANGDRSSVTKSNGRRTLVVQQPQQQRRRIPIMKRKRINNNNNHTQEEHNNDDNSNNRNASSSSSKKRTIEELKKLRKQRIQKRQEKYIVQQQQELIGAETQSVQQPNQDDDNDEIQEYELKMDSDEDANVTAERNNTVHPKDDNDAADIIETTIDQQQKEQQESNKSIICPLCHQSISILDNEQDTDTILAIHMNECQQQNTYQTRSKRPRRQQSQQQQQQPEISYKDDSDENELDDDEYINETSAVAVKPALRKQKEKLSRMYKTSNISVVAPKRAQPVDDMDENDYDDRVDEWIVNGLRRMKHMRERDPDEVVPNDVEYENQFYIPAWMNNHLFQYQRDGMEWLYQLHQQSIGGIIGDEMGLGKTVQVAAFLGAGISSRKIKSVLIVAPATILQHWLHELSIWAPGLRRILIHTSGGSLDRFDRSVSHSLLNSLSKWLRKVRSQRVNEPIDDDDWDTMEPHSFCGTGYAIITTYENLRRNAELYASHDWTYIVLDEAQKIRNPDADITLACKRIRTSHRLAMSGTPIQNDLRELWSLFDFVFPGRLGTLPSFEQEFAVPIKYGGYSNATPMQVQLAYRCAIMLRDMIEPYLLRRLKKDVKEVSRMPGKTEHVLFCRISTRQREIYEAYLQSDDVSRVFRGSHMLLAAVTVLRKICNHPDLVCDPSDAALDSFIRNRGNTRQNVDDDSNSDTSSVGYVGDEQSLLERSGKLDVLAKILPIWKQQGHRVLIFCQWRKMLNIIERFMQMNGWKFGRLDGNTNIASRQRLVDNFNTDESYFCMLCTTRTGGVGLNLIGANRIILYDPDWNPSGDAQARERAWRFGQEKEVTIYRLITAGSIEEKIYQRQIFKTAMTNKILQDPKQRRLFSQRDLKDLFSLTADNGSVRSGGDGITSTSAITNGVGVVERSDLTLNNDDNDIALKKLMKSKGLAGVFDHHSIEPDVKRKSVTVREMEEKAKQIASDAAKALRASVAENDPYTPTWTGSDETKSTGIFGSNRAILSSVSSNGGGVFGQVSSANLLATIRQKNTEIETVGRSINSDDPVTQKYTKLLSGLIDFVRRNRPSTEAILKEYNDIPDTEVVIFRRLLKSVATMENGRWYVNNSV